MSLQTLDDIPRDHLPILLFEANTNESITSKVEFMTPIEENCLMNMSNSVLSSKQEFDKKLPTTTENTDSSFSSHTLNINKEIVEHTINEESAIDDLHTHVRIHCGTSSEQTECVAVDLDESHNMLDGVNALKSNVNSETTTNSNIKKTCFSTLAPIIDIECMSDHSLTPGIKKSVSDSLIHNTCESKFNQNTEVETENSIQNHSFLDENIPSKSKDAYDPFRNYTNNSASKYTSFVMITQSSISPKVSIVTSDTTKLINQTTDQPVTVKHTNWEPKQTSTTGDCTGKISVKKQEHNINIKKVKRSAISNTKGTMDEEIGEDSLSNMESVTVETSSKTLSNVVCLEDGLADDDSWIEDVSQDEDEFSTVTESDSCEEFIVDREEELRGYNRTSIDFTLHTIIEESCEESEVDTPKRASASDLEKYFFFGLGDPGTSVTTTTTVGSKNESYSETSSICSEGIDSLDHTENDIQCMGLSSSRLEKYFLSGFMGFEASDESESVGSDSEGEPSPERRKKLVRARGTGRSQNSSLDNLLNVKDTEEAPKISTNTSEQISTAVVESQDIPEISQSRDSGFIGSNDDLLKDDGKFQSTLELKHELLPEIKEEPKFEKQEELSRKDSFNNWSSDEETNMMMSKMRQFFKTLVAASANTHIANRQTNNFEGHKKKLKPPQLIYFENELTRLMKTVPGIRDDQVREIVEYLSSEDTWSDSYESSEYTSSDVESRTELQEQISASCQQIISKFDGVEDEEGDMGDGGLMVDEPCMNKETAFVYQKLVASLNKISAGEEKPIVDSPPLIAKVITHIGTRLVALMHEVSSGESLASSSPRYGRYHRKLQQKTSSATTTTEDEEDVSDHDFNLPRSKSHDLLLAEKPRMSTSDIGEEKESDYERFSWRGSFESALLAPNDSRTKLTTIEGSSVTMTSIEAKRRSAGDLLFNTKSLSREQLDRVRSCGSIGGDEADKFWPGKQQCHSLTTCDTDNSSDESDTLVNRSTLPRSLNNGISANTNSLPRLSSSQPVAMSQLNSNTCSNAITQKSLIVHQMLQNSVKSARYRAPGFNNRVTMPAKRAMSAPGLQPIYMKRDRRKFPTVGKLIELLLINYEKWWF